MQERINKKQYGICNEKRVTKVLKWRDVHDTESHNSSDVRRVRCENQ